MAALFCMVLLPELLPCCRDLGYILSGACQLSAVHVPRQAGLHCRQAACGACPRAVSRLTALMAALRLRATRVVLSQLLLSNADMCLTFD